MTRFLGQFYEHNDDEDNTTEEKLRVIGHILTLIEVVVEGVLDLAILDLGFELYDLNTCFLHVVPCHTGAV